MSPVIVYTDNQGRAVATFQSGTLSSAAPGVTVQASVVVMPPPVPPIVATTNIVIGGTPGSVAINRGSSVVIVDSTTYNLPMSVVVADANGNPPVQGTTVSLSLWPTQYSTGLWYDSNPDPDKKKFVPYVTGTFINEDTNEDMYKNTGEDVNLNGILDPPNSAAGTVPTTVTTDQYGVGNFYITYPKQSAVWIVARVRANVEVSGTETTSFITLRLPSERTEAEAGDLPDSNYNIGLTVAAGGTVNYNLPLFNSINATYSTSSAYSSFPTLPSPTPSLYKFDTTLIPGGAVIGTIYYDTITVQDLYLGTFLIPVNIVIE